MAEQLLVATRKGLFSLRKANGSWRVQQRSFVADPVSLVLSDRRDGAWYAALDLGHFGTKLHRSRDAGQSWQEIAAPCYPEKPEGVEDKGGSGQEVPWTLKTVWALTAGGADQPGRLWCGTIPGGLFCSDDHGESWALNEPLWNHESRKAWFGGGADFPGIHSILIDPRNSKRIIAAVSCGGVWLSEDDGQSWHCRADGMRAAYMPPDQAERPEIQDPHCVVLCPAAPDTLWAQHHNGIFRSTDGCASWHEITSVAPSSFGFPVAVHPQDPQTAWFVPAAKDEKRIPVDGKVVVTRTRDGGASFETLREGLPQQDAYDLTYRHALDVDESGDCLAFGSTTGSLWLSEDGGDRWQHVSAHLPPIYCIRFA